MQLMALLKACSRIVNRLPIVNSIVGKRNNSTVVKGLLLFSRIRVKGQGNTIIIKEGSMLYKSNISIHGNNNRLEIGANAHIKHASFNFEDNSNVVFVGEGTAMLGRINIACLERTTIQIGADCLFSAGVEIRTSDSHSILNLVGERINPAESIRIEDRVWCGQGVYILKGSAIGADTVVGAGSIVSRKFSDSNCVLAGIPAKVVRRNTVWARERIVNG